MPKEHLFVLPTANIGGAERVVFNIIYYLLKKNENVILVTMSRGKGNTWTKFELFKNFEWFVGDYPSEKSSLLPITKKLYNISKNRNIDLIFTTHVHVNSYLSVLKKIGLFPNSILISRESSVVFERNNGYKKRFFKLMYRYLYSQQDLLVCQTEFMKQSLLDVLGYSPASKLAVIPNPVNIEFIKSNISDNGKKDYIIACGRFIKLKQFDLLIEAFSNIQKEYPNFKLIILGEGSERQNIKSQVHELGLQNSVILPGKVSNPFQWFARAKIGVISSQIEGFPNVLLEMMASGINHVVSTPCTEGVRNIPNIIVTEDTSASSIYAGLISALNSSSDYSKFYQKYVNTEHSVASFWDSVISI